MKYDTAQTSHLKISNFKFQISKGKKGFTLIELLIVISIIGMLVGLSVAAYSTFNKNQSYNNAVNDLVNMLQVARSRAVSQYAPSQYCGAGAPNLQNYQVILSSAPKSISLKVFCGSPPALQPTPLQTVSVAGNVTLNPSSHTFIFAVGTGAVSPAQIITVTSDSGTQRHVQVDTNGRVILN